MALFAADNQYAQDPRYALAKQLMASGQQPEQTQMVGGLAVPQSPLAGLSRALQQGLGGYQIGQLKNEYEQKQANSGKLLADALTQYKGGDVTDAPGPNPDGSAGYTAHLKANPNAAIAKLLTNPDTAEIGASLATKQLEPKTPVKLGAGEQLLDGNTFKPLATGAPKSPTGYTTNPDGSMTAIKGGPGDQSSKPPNEYQGKSGTFAARMADAEKIIADKGVAGTDPAQAAKSGVPLIGNYLVSDDYQQFDQAKRNFINAVLRQESGAAINKSEFDNAEKQYFPRPGDTPATIAQKAQNRQTAFQQMAKASGSAYTPGDAAKPTTNSPFHPTAAIPPEQRTAGQVYPTPKGNMKWTGTGWLPAN